MDPAIPCGRRGCRNRTKHGSGHCAWHRSGDTPLREAGSLLKVAPSRSTTYLPNRLTLPESDSSVQAPPSGPYCPSRFGLPPGVHYRNYTTYSSDEDIVTERFLDLAEDVKNSLSDHEGEMVYRYVSDEEPDSGCLYYALVNDGLRDPSQVESRSEQFYADGTIQRYDEVIRAMDDILDRHGRMDRPMVVYRGIVVKGDQEQSRWATSVSAGDVITDPGYWSATVNPVIAEDFARDSIRSGPEDAVVFEIVTDRGMPMMHDEQDLQDEVEVLLPRGSTFTVLEVIEGDAKIPDAISTQDILANNRRRRRVVRMVESSLLEKSQQDDRVSVYKPMEE